jgi:hypothetical protein
MRKPYASKKTVKKSCRKKDSKDLSNIDFPFFQEDFTACVHTLQTTMKTKNTSGSSKANDLHCGHEVLEKDLWIR